METTKELSTQNDQENAHTGDRVYLRSLLPSLVFHSPQATRVLRKYEVSEPRVERQEDTNGQAKSKDRITETGKGTGT